MKRAEFITADEVIEFRTLKSWTQGTAAEWAGVTERQWQRYESGDSGVKKFLAERIQSRLVRLRGRR